MFRLLPFFIFLSSPLFCAFDVSLKDLVSIHGVKKNYITGIGLVVGLPGTGDKTSKLTEKSLKQFLNYTGNNSHQFNLQTKNTAMVALSAELNGLQTQGDLVDIQVSSIADADSINNGYLLQSVLKGPDGKIYVVASGVVSSGDKNNARRGLVTDGGILEKSLIEYGNFQSSSEIILNMKRNDIYLINEVLKRVSEKYSDISIEQLNYKKLILKSKQSSFVPLERLVLILKEKFSVQTPAKIVINKNTGLVLVANNVRIDDAYVSLPGLDIQIAGDKKEKIEGILKQNSSVSELASQFNEIGLNSENIITIFKALKSCGAMNADIIVQ